jgi:hypothetical protein
MIRRSLICIFTGLLISCDHTEKINPSNSLPTARINIANDVNKFILDGSHSSAPNGDSLTYTWSTTSTLINILSPVASKSFFMIPIEPGSFTVDISLKVSDGLHTNVTTQTVLVPAINQAEYDGLGAKLNDGTSNNKAYDWYLDQGNSGTYSLVNCGPTSVTMAIKWANKGFDKTPEDARQMYRSTGGWWYTDDIINYLNYYDVSNYTVVLTDINQLKTYVDNGNIIILCLDMFYVDYQADATFHFSKFYPANTQGWGHFIVIKGYKDVDSQTFFEAYDPYSFGSEYRDNSLKGKDRYYRATNLYDATSKWWAYAIIVSPPGSTGGRTADPNAVDPSTITHKSGQ